MSDPALDFSDPEDDIGDQGGDGALNLTDPEDEPNDPVRAAQAEVDRPKVKVKRGGFGDVMLGELDGLLMNYGSELEGLGIGGALGNKLADWFGASEGRPEGQPYDNGSVTPIDDALKTNRGKTGNLVGNILGGGALGMATGNIGPAAGTLGNIAKGYLAQGAIGAGQSVVAGAGRREGEERFDPASMVKDASIGGALGMGGRALGTAIGKYLAAKGAAPSAVPVDAVVDGAPTNAGRPIVPGGAPSGVQSTAAFDDLTSRAPLELQDIAPRIPRGAPAADTIPDIPHDAGGVRARLPAAGPYGTLRINPAETAPMRAPDTIPDIPYDVPQTIPDGPMPMDQTMAAAPRVRLRAAQERPPPDTHQHSYDAIDPGPAAAELAPAVAREGVRGAGVAQVQAMKRAGEVQEPFLAQAAKALNVVAHPRREAASMAIKLMQKGRDAYKASPSYAPDEVALKGVGAWSSELSRIRTRNVAKPDVATLTWAMQSMNAQGKSGLPPEDQARFDEVLLSGDQNKISAAYMQLSMKYPRFQKMAAEQLESINDASGG